ncbi:hypothetical protein MG293_004244 [Ovis ammon polii]|uniref:Uncharacterized protein n=1 Tax=Ovis ammon polii TaxID=230172 RepID=A0AAD4UBE6_OVIAM|nr:hypothetical protein MG293_004244 [Ovis ammon polii]
MTSQRQQGQARLHTALFVFAASFDTSLRMEDFWRRAANNAKTKGQPGLQTKSAPSSVSPDRQIRSMAHIYPHAKNSLMYGECQDSFSSWTACNQETVSFLQYKTFAVITVSLLESALFSCFQQISSLRKPPVQDPEAGKFGGAKDPPTCPMLFSGTGALFCYHICQLGFKCNNALGLNHMSIDSMKDLI